MQLISFNRTAKVLLVDGGSMEVDVLAFSHGLIVHQDVTHSHMLAITHLRSGKFVMRCSSNVPVWMLQSMLPALSVGVDHRILTNRKSKALKSVVRAIQAIDDVYMPKLQVVKRAA